MYVGAIGGRRQLWWGIKSKPDRDGDWGKGTDQAAGMERRQGAIIVVQCKLLDTLHMPE